LGGGDFGIALRVISKLSPEPPERVARGIVAAFASILCFAVMPTRPVLMWVLVLVSLSGLSCRVGLDLKRLGRRLLWFGLLVGVTGIGLSGHVDWERRMMELWLRGTASFWTSLLLTGSYTREELLRGLRRLPLPPLAVDLVAFWQRYSVVLAEEWQRLALAHRARTVHWTRVGEFRLMLFSLGILFIRAYERAERVHRSMLARGYKGR